MHLPEFLNLGAGFSKYFRALPAVDDDLRRSVFRIRHAVYCEELGYEAIRDDGLESDSYDPHSVYCLLESVGTGEQVGCVRLILADRNNPRTQFPFEQLCETSLDRGIVDPAQLDRTKIAEVSRLAVIGRYRRRRGEQKVPLGIDESDFGTPDRPRFPYIAAGLYLGMIAQARHHGVETLFMLTDRRLCETALAARRQAADDRRADRAPRHALSVNDVGAGSNRRVQLFRPAAVRRYFGRDGGCVPARGRISVVLPQAHADYSSFFR
jgi:putative PEP-CTERM/exosortase system-associated acyltransferase